MLGLAVLGMVGCEPGKNNDPVPAVNPNTPPADSTGSDPNQNPNLGKCMLSEAKWISSGTEYIISFKYDENKRVTRQTIKEDGVEDPYHTRYTYSSGFPFRVERNVYYRNNTPLNADKFEYNADGQLIKTSYIEYTAQGSTNGTLRSYYTYEYRPDKMLSRRNEYNDQNELTGYVVYTYPTANAVTRHEYSVTAGITSLSVKTEFSFDDKKSFVNTLGVILSDELVSYHNEIASTSTYYNPADVISGTTTYEYNAEGLPTKSTSNYGGTTEVVFLTYNCQ